ncbi:MAG: hypothetical protein ACK4F7_03850 [Inhella sp.]
MVSLPLLMAELACGESPAPPAEAVAPESEPEISTGPALKPSKTVQSLPPCIVQEGCDFWLVTDSGVISTRSARGSGLSGQARLSWGGQEMQLADCEVVGNPGNLPVF